MCTIKISQCNIKERMYYNLESYNIKSIKIITPDIIQYNIYFTIVIDNRFHKKSNKDEIKYHAGLQLKNFLRIGEEIFNRKYNSKLLFLDTLLLILT